MLKGETAETRSAFVHTTATAGGAPPGSGVPDAAASLCCLSTNATGLCRCARALLPPAWNGHIHRRGAPATTGAPSSSGPPRVPSDEESQDVSWSTVCVMNSGKSDTSLHRASCERNVEVSQGCALSSEARARRCTSFTKQRNRKSCRSSDSPSGSGGCASFTMWYIADICVSSKCGGTPVSNSSTVQPTDQMSEAVVKADISMVSGAIQYGVPTTDCVLSCSSVRRATPKSASFTCPSRVTSTLAPLMSR
mmetsp:Transcript_4502/g.10850  ORF Transcript_4502/g.10850 Transcript_4502/m.10850 type:complete len:251 (+) Transcript_4502:570-1322(+)